MSPAGFKQALEAGKLANNGKPLDAVLFDACRMAAVEVACQLVGSVGVAIASMDNIASTGYSMAEVVRSAEASEDARELGEKLVYNDAPQQRGSCLTLSAIDLDRLQPLQTAIASLAEQLGKLQPETARSVRRVSELTRRNTASPDSWDLLDMLSDHILGSKTFDAQAFAQWMEARQPGPAVALVGFCANLLDQEALMTTHPQLKATLSDVIAAHDQAVFAARAADQDSWPGGLSITLPLSSTGGPLYKDGPLAFEQTTHWSRAVDVVVPAGEPAQHVPTWLEKELESRGVQTPAPPAA